MWRYIWILPVYFACSSFALFFEIGRNFEYEYSLITTVLSFCLIPLVALLTPSEHIPFRNGKYTPYIAFDLVWIFILGPILALIPPILFFYYFNCPCSQTGTVFWIIVQAVPAWIIGHGLYHLVFKVRCMMISKLKIFFGMVLSFFLLALGLVLTIWFNPQVRVVNLVFGFIHGPIYDNWIDVDMGIIFARVSHLLIGLAVLIYAWYHKNERAYRFVALVLFICWSASVYLSSTFPSTQLGKASLDRLLPETIEGDNFVIHYTGKTDDDSTPLPIENLHDEVKFHFEDLGKKLGKTPKVSIYVYPNADLKKIWFGGGATDVTDVVTPSIHITASKTPHPTLRHELVHALGSSFGYHGLGFHPNMAFTEGLAMALAPEERDISLHDGSAALFKSNRLPDLNSLFSPFFWKESGSRAYTVAGSIISYLLEEYGLEKVKLLYSGKKWDEVFPLSQKQILLKWRDSILKGYASDQMSLYAEAVYRYPGVLKTLCPHSKSDLQKSRNENIFVRLRQPLGWDPKNYWVWRVDIDDEDRWSLVTLWSNEISMVASQRVPPIGRLQTWRDAVHQLRYWPPKTIEDIELSLLDADLTRVLDGKEASVEMLNKLSSYTNQKWVGSNLTRQIEARLRVESVLNDADALSWRQYLAGWKKELPLDKIEWADIWIVNYLKLRRGEKSTLDTTFLAKAVNMEIPIDLNLSFKTEWYKYLGHRLVQLRSYQSAESAYAKASSLLPNPSNEIYKQYARFARSLQK